MKLDPIRLVEACYAVHLDEGAWAQGLVEALAPAQRGFGIVAASNDVTRAPMDRMRALAALQLGPEQLDSFRRWWADVPPQVGASMHRIALPVVELASERLWGPHPETLASFRKVYEDIGASDSLAMVASSDGKELVQLHIGIPRRGTPPPPRVRRQLGSAVAHLAAGLRLRGALSGRRPAPDDPLTEAVLDAGGRLVHLAKGAERRDARGRLVAAVRRMDRARGRLRRASPEQALALWDALVDGRWSLVDHVESDGRRWILARRNAPGAHDPRALSPRERAVLALAIEGRSNKFIGAELGCAPSTVAGHLARCEAKLGVASRRELIELAGAGARGPEVGSADAAGT